MVTVKIQVTAELPATETNLRALVMLRNSLKDMLQMAKRQGRSELEIGGLQWQLQQVKDRITATGATQLEIIELCKKPESPEPVDETRPHRVDRYGKKHLL